MFRQSMLIASAAAATLVAIPGAAEAQYYRGYSQSYYGQPTYYPQPYRQQAYGYGYRQPAYGYQQQNYYGQQRYYGRHRHRCGNGTTGLIVGGAAGALLGREVGRNSARRSYYGRSNGGGTTGAIIGGAIGALVGRGVARSC